MVMPGGGNVPTTSATSVTSQQQQMDGKDGNMTQNVLLKQLLSSSSVPPKSEPFPKPGI